MSLRMGRLGFVLIAVGLMSLAGGAVAVYAQSGATVGMTEFAFDPAALVVSAGRDTFTLRNDGRFPHNMHVEGNGVSVDVKPDGPVAGSESFTGAVSLSPGTYIVWCPVSNHRERGMEGTLTVASAGAGSAVQLPVALPRTGSLEITPLAGAGAGLGVLLVSLGSFLISVRRRA